jgi:hypothetical protein
MIRREFITLLGARNRTKGPVRLGFLPIGSPRNAYDRSLAEAFQEGLRRVGLIENQNIVLDVVWVGDSAPRMTVLGFTKNWPSTPIFCSRVFAVRRKLRRS